MQLYIHVETQGKHDSFHPRTKQITVYITNICQSTALMTQYLTKSKGTFQTNNLALNNGNSKVRGKKEKENISQKSTSIYFARRTEKLISYPFQLFLKNKQKTNKTR